MPSTDTRIVQMQFDNKEFEKNIAVSQESLEKFKDELDFDEQEKNLRDFEDATDRLTFESMAENLQKLTDKFTGLGTVSELILSQLRRGIESAAAQMSSFVRSLTTEQVNAGMSKFEMLNKSVQTIKAATGDTEETVYSVLDRLNRYTDQTSYNFSDMASNIGKFTSVGIPLEKAEKQMEGIANWAARSGAGVAEASRAMYNLSQAMGVGSLKLMDWKSIENAGMATKEFKEQLIDAGIAAGTLEVSYDKAGNRTVKTAKKLGKQVEITYKNVSETLNKGWANQEVIGNTLEKYYYEDLYYEGEVAALIDTTREQRDEIRNMLKEDNQISSEDWEQIGLETEENTEKLFAAAVAQKKITKEINDEGYAVYYMLDKNGKKTKQVVKDIQDLFSNNLIDTSMAETLFGLNNDALIEATDSQLESVRSALGENDLILLKDWTEGMTEAGLATDEVKQAAIDAAVAQGNLIKETTKDGKTIYKTAKKYGDQMEVTLDNFDQTLKMKWFDADTADIVFRFKNLGKASYGAAQKCLSFTDVLGAWKDMLSTGWMTTYNHIFGQLTESMQLFSTICNKVSDALAELMDERNKILEIWASWGGRENLWSMLVGEYGEGEDLMYEGAYGFLDVLIDVGKLIHDGFWNMIKLMVPTDLFDEMLGTEEFQKMFPDFQGSFDEFWEMDGAKESFFAYKITETINKIKEFIQSIKDFMNEVPAGAGETRLQMLQDVVNGIFASFLLVYTVFKHIASFFESLIGRLQPGIDAVTAMLSRLGIGISDTSKDAAQGDGLTNFFNGLLDALQPLIDAVNDILGLFSQLFIKIIDKGTQNGSFQKIIDFFGKLLTLFADIISNVAGPIIDFIGNVVDAFSELFEGGINEESMKKFGEKILGAFDDLINGIFEALFGKDVGKKINEFFGYLFGFDPKDLEEGEAQTIVGSLRIWIKKLFGLIGGLFKSFKNENGDYSLFSLLKSNLGIGGVMNLLNEINTMLKGTNIFGILEALGTIATLFKAFQLFSAGKETIKGVKNFFTGLNDSLKEGFKLDLNYKAEDSSEKFLKIAESIALLAAAVAVLGSMNITSLAKGVVAVAAIMGLMWLFTKLMKKTVTGMKIDEIIPMTAQIGLMGFSIMMIALGMAVLVNALKPLANMKIDQIMMMLTGLLGVVTIIGIFVKALVDNKIGGIKAKDMMGIGILGLGVGILIKSLLPLSEMTSLDPILKMLAGLGGILAILYVFVDALTKTGDKFKGKGLWSVIGLALGVAILMNSLMPLSEMTSIDPIVKMLAGLGGILAELVLFSKYMDGSSFGKKGLGSIILLAAGIWLLMQSILPMVSIPLGSLAKAIGGLGVILLELKLFNDGLGSYRFGEMAGMIAVAVSMWILVKALIPLTTVPFWGMVQALAGFAAILVMMHLFLENTQGMNIREGLGTLIGLMGIAVVLVAFGFSMKLMSEVPWYTIVVAVLALSLLLIVYVGMVDTINNNEKSILKGTHALIAMVGLAAVLLIFSMALNEIKNVDNGKIILFSVGLAILLVAIGTAMKSVEKINIGAALKAILILAVAVGVMMLVMAALMPIVTGAIGSSLQNMSAKLTLTSDMIANFIGKMQQFSQADIEDAKAKFEKLVELFASLKDVSSYYSAVQSFSTLLVDLGAGILLFAAMTQNVPDPTKSNAIKTVVLILDMKDEFTAFSAGSFPTDVAMIGAGISLFADLTTNITDANPVALKLAQNIINKKKSFESFSIGNFQDEVTRLGAGLSLFNTESANVTTGEPPALEMLYKLLNAKKLINDFKNVDVDSFSGKLSALGGALSVYASGAYEAGGLYENDETPDVSKAVGLLQAISDSFASEDGNFTIPEIQQTEEDLGLFGAKLSALATAMKQFSEASDGLDDGKTKLALKVLTFVKDLQTDLTEDNVKRVAIFTKSGVSEYTISTFATDIVAIAGAMVSFTDAANSFDKGKTTLALDTLSFLADLKSSLTEDNLKTVNAFKDAGIASTYTITTFADEVKALGAGLADFTTKTKDVGTLTNAKTALRFLAWLKDNLTTQDIEATKRFKGTGVTTESLEQFAKDITALGNALAEFANNVNFDESKTKNFDAALTSLDFLVKLQKKMPVIGGIAGIIEGNVETLGSLAADIVSLGTSMKEFSDALAGGGNADMNFDFELVQNALKALSTMTELANLMGQSDGDDIYNNYVWFGRMAEMFSSMTDEGAFDNPAYNTVSSFIDGLVNFMIELNSKIAAAGGIDSTSNLEAFKLTIQAIKDLADISGDESLNFEPIGYQIAAGVAQGILGEEANEQVVLAARTMIQRIKEAAADEAIIESPSRLFADSIGKYISLGIGKGIEENSANPENAAKDAVDSAIFGAEGALGQLWNLLTNGTDSDPTIRPVLDLTNVEAGVAQMNGMFGGQYGMSINPSVATQYAANSVPNATSSAEQTPTDLSGIMSSLSAMSAQIGNLGERISGMKLYLDSKTLVGGLTSGIDAALGRAGFYSGRRN